MSSARVSPLLSLPGAVAGDGVDAPVAGHYTVVDADLGEEWPDVEQADLGQHE